MKYQNGFILLGNLCLYTLYICLFLEHGLPRYNFPSGCDCVTVSKGLLTKTLELTITADEHHSPGPDDHTCLWMIK